MSPRYHIVRLGPLPRIAAETAPALGPDGAAGAWFEPAPDRRRAVLYVRGMRRELPAPGGLGTAVTGLNGRGQAVGIAFDRRDPGRTQALHWTGESHQLLAPDAVSIACGIADDGRIAGGIARGGALRAVRWEPGGLREIGTLPGGDYSLAQAIDRRGVVVGISTARPRGKNRAFRWQEGNPEELPPLPGGTSAHARAIGDSGDIAGWSENAEGETTAVLWRSGRPIDLGSLGTEPSSAWGVNARGQAVGTSANANRKLRAFLWEADQMVDLNSLLEGGAEWQLQIAFGINDRGQILARGLFRRETCLALLEPV